MCGEMLEQNWAADGAVGEPPRASGKFPYNHTTGATGGRRGQVPSLCTLRPHKAAQGWVSNMGGNRVRSVMASQGPLGKLTGRLF